MPVVSGAASSYVYGLSAKGVDSRAAERVLNARDEDPRRAFPPHARPRIGDHVVPYRAPPTLPPATGSATHGGRRISSTPSTRTRSSNVADPTHPDKAFCYFLEIERAKLGNYRNGEPQILRKLQKYYEYFNSTDCEKEWGFRQFRVIVVQRTDARREGLLTALRKTYSHRMFWLTTEAAYRTDIGGAIFKTPKDDAPVPFSFLIP